jgi:hypothetical protein
MAILRVKKGGIPHIWGYISIKIADNWGGLFKIASAYVYPRIQAWQTRADEQWAKRWII